MTACQTLGVAPEASLREVERAFRRAIQVIELERMGTTDPVQRDLLDADRLRCERAYAALIRPAGGQEAVVDLTRAERITVGV